MRVSIYYNEQDLRSNVNTYEESYAILDLSDDGELGHYLNGCGISMMDIITKNNHGEGNHSSKDDSSIDNYDLEEMFPLDYQRIGEIKGIKAKNNRIIAEIFMIRKIKYTIIHPKLNNLEYQQIDIG